MKSTTSRRKDSTRDQIIHSYMDQLQESGRPPASVRRICQHLKISEEAFYKEFPTMDAIEKHFWKGWMDHLIKAVSNGKEWKSFTAKQQYLAFLFAFSEAGLKHRSLLEQRFGKLTLLCNPSWLDYLKDSFKDFAAELIGHGMESGEIASRGPLGNFYPEVLYIHWRSVLGYFLKDESHGFEQTDAFVEKTVEFAFDLLRTQVIDSAADLLRFLIPQITHFGRKH